ncbi:MAG: hypothetical protein RMK99_03790 [Anaerolineales bacterium]|nr:hypothetical protein [Anaerolineales bacterium]
MAELYIVTYDTHGLSLEGRKFSQKQIMNALQAGLFRPGMRFRRGRVEYVLTRDGLMPRRRTAPEQKEQESPEGEE